jgi:hypothetical protein
VGGRELDPPKQAAGSALASRGRHSDGREDSSALLQAKRMGGAPSVESPLRSQPVSPGEDFSEKKHSKWVDQWYTRDSARHVRSQR